MGAALLLKPALRQRFSVLVFGASQVAIDIEPLVRMLRDDDILHGWTHTVPGALLSAWIGTGSHLLFDAIMHADMRPLAPLSAYNPLLGAVSLSTLHLGLVAAGAVGLLGLALPGRNASDGPAS